jgi:CBS domain-containing protein
MKTTAKDVMSTEFTTLQPETPIRDAVQIFKNSYQKQKRRIFGLMVTDAEARLVGMLSMYDILLFMRPKHIHIWGMMEDMDIIGVIDNACSRITSIQVGDIMSTDMITVNTQTHLMMVLDLMIKKHVRRIPVLEKNRIVGIIYISDLFYHLLDRLDYS